MAAELRKAFNGHGIDWNGFRSIYQDLTFDELAEINDTVDELYPIQEQYHAVFFARMFREIGPQPLKVVELGCHRGQLARRMFRNFNNIESWVGYDFTKPVEKTICADKRFQPVALSDWFHKTDLPEFNVFVCSHTLEHLSQEQVMETLNHINGADYILTETPIPEHGISWNNWTCTHVLTAGLGHVREWLLDNKYELFCDVSRLGILGAKLNNRSNTNG